MSAKRKTINMNFPHAGTESVAVAVAIGNRCRPRYKPRNQKVDHWPVPYLITTAT